MLLVWGAASPLGSGKTKPAQPQVSTAMQAIWEAMGHLSAESLVLHQQRNLTGKVPSFPTAVPTAVAESAATLESSLPIPLPQGDLCGPHTPFGAGLICSPHTLLCCVAGQVMGGWGSASVFSEDRTGPLSKAPLPIFQEQRPHEQRGAQLLPVDPFSVL